LTGGSGGGGATCADTDEASRSVTLPCGIPSSEPTVKRFADIDVIELPRRPAGRIPICPLNVGRR
jgi:hypothetical protein